MSTVREFVMKRKRRREKQASSQASITSFMGEPRVLQPPNSEPNDQELEEKVGGKNNDENLRVEEDSKRDDESLTKEESDRIWSQKARRVPRERNGQLQLVRTEQRMPKQSAEDLDDSSAPVTISKQASAEKGRQNSSSSTSPPEQFMSREELQDELKRTREELLKSRTQCHHFKQKYWSVVDKYQRWWEELQEWIPKHHSGPAPQIEGLLPVVTPASNKSGVAKRLPHGNESDKENKCPHQQTTPISKNTGQSVSFSQDTVPTSARKILENKSKKRKRMAASDDQEEGAATPVAKTRVPFLTITNHPPTQSNRDDYETPMTKKGTTTARTTAAVELTGTKPEQPATESQESVTQLDKPMSESRLVPLRSNTIQGYEIMRKQPPSPPLKRSRSEPARSSESDGDSKNGSPSSSRSSSPAANNTSQPLLAGSKAMSRIPAWTTNKHARSFMLEDTIVPTRLMKKNAESSSCRPTSPKSSRPESSNTTTTTKFKYQEVVRKKAERQDMPGHFCRHCNQFVDVVCKDDCISRKDLQDCSRHRCRHSPSYTPDGYWDLSFLDEKRAKEQQDN